MKDNINKVSHKECTGCTACLNSCGKKAISFEPDCEGFLYPNVDNNLCVECGMCNKVCQAIEKIDFQSPIECYAAQNQNHEDLLKSSSGGMFLVFAKEILNNGGYVSGCVLTENFVAKHIVTNDLDEVYKMCGSKYVQSDLNNCFSQIKQLLIENKIVLFVGTPCQVSGLKLFLKKEYENLITLDFVCHGVPSPLLLKKYITEFEGKGIKIIEFKFRDKKINGWKFQGSIKYLNGKKIKIKSISSNNTSYFNLYHLNYINRYACYDCKFSTVNRVSDITIGDFWNVDYMISELTSSKGYSLLISNTIKGDKLIDTIKNKVLFNKVSTEMVIRSNLELSSKRIIPEIRNSIYFDINKNGLEKTAKKVCKYKYFTPFIKNITPKFIKKIIKKILKKV